MTAFFLNGVCGYLKVDVTRSLYIYMPLRARARLYNEHIANRI